MPEVQIAYIEEAVPCKLFETDLNGVAYHIRMTHKKHAKELTEMKEKHAEELTEVKEKHAEELTEVKEKHAEELTEAIQENEAFNNQLNLAAAEYEHLRKTNEIYKQCKQGLLALTYTWIQAESLNNEYQKAH